MLGFGGSVAMGSKVLAVCLQVTLAALLFVRVLPIRRAVRRL